MSSLSASLPKPKKTILTSKWANSTQQPKQTPNQQAKQTLIQQPINQSHISTPKYGERQSYRPSQTKDYFDGGSFPEIRIVQFPLDMGRSQTSNANRSTLPLQTDKGLRLTLY